MVGRDEYMAGRALVLERLDEYRSARCLKGVRLIKKLVRPLYLLLVGILPASGCLISARDRYLLGVDSTVSVKCLGVDSMSYFSFFARSTRLMRH